MICPVLSAQRETKRQKTPGVGDLNPNTGTVNPRRRAFTLVEMLMVVTIIGILAALLMVGVQSSIRAGNRAVLKTDISQFAAALERYKAANGAYPPDCSMLAIPNNAPAELLVAREACRTEVLAHLRRAFPRYRPIGDVSNPANTPTPWSKFVFDVQSNYGINPNNFDAATALVFWLGGLPEEVPNASQSTWQPDGFHSDATFPFKPGGPRTERFFEFGPLPVSDWTQNHLYYRPKKPRYLNETSAPPYVYFRARKLGKRYDFGWRIPDNGGGPDQFMPASYPIPTAYPPAWPATAKVAVPYMSGSPLSNVGLLATDRTWRDEEKYQVLSAGLDGEYGGTKAFRYSKSGIGADSTDNDNMASFMTGTLEDEFE